MKQDVEDFQKFRPRQKNDSHKPNSKKNSDLQSKKEIKGKPKTDYEVNKTESEEQAE